MKGTLTAELMAILGPDNTRRLIQTYGGTLLYIPKSSLDHPIAHTLGEAIARPLCAHYGGMRIQIPTGQSMALEARNEAIHADRQQGLSVHAISKKYGLCIRQTYYILSQEPDPAQPAPMDPPPVQQLALF